MTPEPPPAHDDEAGSADDRFDRRIAFAVVGALAVAAAVGPFGWHLLSNGFNGSSNSASAAVAAIGGGGGGIGNGNGVNGGNGSNSLAAIVSAPTSGATSPSSGASPSPSGKSSSAAEGASASCAAALGNAKTVSGATGTSASVGSWAVMATPSVNALRANAATLHGVVTRQDAASVPAAAKSLCDNVGSVGQLAAMPDAVGATAWQAALSAYVAGATDALAAASSHPAYFQAAQAQLTQGEQELDALSARIIATTQH